MAYGICGLCMLCIVHVIVIMEALPTEVLHSICLMIGYKDTLQLCRVNSVLNDRITNDTFLWSKFADKLISTDGVHYFTINGIGSTKTRFLYMLCFDLYLRKDIMEATPHNCRK